MGKKRMAALMVALCVCLCLGLAGCGARSDMERGAWQGDTFVNSWAGVSFTRPAELALDEDLLDELKAQGTSLAFQEFCLRTEDKGLIIVLSYENIAATPEVTEADYLASVRQSLEKNTTPVYECGEVGSTTVAGQPYADMLATINRGERYQRILARKQGNSMGVWNITYAGEADRARADAFLAAVTAP